MIKVMQKGLKMLSMKIEDDEVKITVEKIECLNRDAVPGIDENVMTDLDLDNIDKIASFTIYKREKKDCPFARGNWIADITYIDGTTLCLKLPIVMAEEKVIIYFKPLIDKLVELKNNVKNRNDLH